MTSPCGVRLFPLPQLAVGVKLDAMDSEGVWSPAQVVKINRKGKGRNGNVLVSFVGWGPKWNETVSLRHIAERGSRTAILKARLRQRKAWEACRVHVRTPGNQAGVDHLRGEPAVYVETYGPIKRKWLLAASVLPTKALSHPPRNHRRCLADAEARQASFSFAPGSLLSRASLKALFPGFTLDISDDTPANDGSSTDSPTAPPELPPSAPKRVVAKTKRNGAGAGAGAGVSPPSTPHAAAASNAGAVDDQRPHGGMDADTAVAYVPDTDDDGERSVSPVGHSTHPSSQPTRHVPDMSAPHTSTWTPLGAGDRFVSSVYQGVTWHPQRQVWEVRQGTAGAARVGCERLAALTYDLWGDAAGRRRAGCGFRNLPEECKLDHHHAAVGRRNAALARFPFSVHTLGWCNNCDDGSVCQPRVQAAARAYAAAKQPKEMLTMQLYRRRQFPHDVPVGSTVWCDHCGTSSPPVWYTALDGMGLQLLLCKECGQHVAIHQKRRPVPFRPSAAVRRKLVDTVTEQDTTRPEPPRRPAPAPLVVLPSGNEGVHPGGAALVPRTDGLQRPGAADGVAEVLSWSRVRRLQEAQHLVGSGVYWALGARSRRAPVAPLWPPGHEPPAAIVAVGHDAPSPAAVRRRKRQRKAPPQRGPAGAPPAMLSLPDGGLHVAPIVASRPATRQLSGAPATVLSHAAAVRRSWLTQVKPRHGGGGGGGGGGGVDLVWRASDPLFPGDVDDGPSMTSVWTALMSDNRVCECPAWHDVACACGAEPSKPAARDAASSGGVAAPYPPSDPPPTAWGRATFVPPPCVPSKRGDAAAHGERQAAARRVAGAWNPSRGGVDGEGRRR